MEKDNAYCAHCHHHHNPWWRLVKTFFGAFIVLLALLVGIGIGQKAELYRLSGKPGMMNFAWKNPTAGAANSWSGLPPMMYINANGSASAAPAPSGAPLMLTGRAPLTSGQRVAGVITKIDGNKITLTDNGGGTQVVYTSASTVISNSTVEMPLASLKVKQFIVCYVKDSQNIANSIQVQ